MPSFILRKKKVTRKKVTKKRKSTRRNTCLPCNPGLRRIRRRNPDDLDLAFDFASKALKFNKEKNYTKAMINALKAARIYKQNKLEYMQYLGMMEIAENNADIIIFRNLKTDHDLIFEASEIFDKLGVKRYSRDLLTLI